MKHFKQKQKQKKNKIMINNKGFTLIEILTIIVIIGILLGAILVSMKGIQENAEKKSLMRTMGTVVRAVGMCDEINYAVPAPGIMICTAPVSNFTTYPVLDLKLTNHGYSYGWSGSPPAIGSDLIGQKDGVDIIRCYVGSGSCEML